MGGYTIGVNIPGGTGMAALPKALEQITADGWQAAELNLSSCPLILGGKIQPQVLAYVRSVLEQYPLHYTAHASYGLDLRDPDPIHQQALLSSVEACAALHIDRFNVHYEERSRDSQAERRYMERLGLAVNLGADLGVAVNVENVEVEDCRYALEAVVQLAHPNCGMTLDLGHLWLSANYFGYDYLATVEACAPYVRHLHINDNHGVFEPMRLSNYHVYNTLDKGYRFQFSRGDIHIPPLWGNVPMKEAFAILKRAGYRGIWLCEYYSQMFAPLNGRIRRDTLAAIAEA